jgi:hypothetical protein
MVEKFAIIGGKVPSEFLDLNHTSSSLGSGVPMSPKFALSQRQALANFGPGTPAAE